jgi:DNA-binding Xre family transcriptional regulator
MVISYKKLFKLLIDKDMNGQHLVQSAGISSATLVKLRKSKNVTTDVLLKICRTLGCELHDIMEIDRCPRQVAPETPEKETVTSAEPTSQKPNSLSYW